MSCNMEEKKMLLIINPNAGQKKARKSMFYLVDKFCKHGYSVTTYTTGKKCDATEYVKEYGKEYNIIISCGGDGTINEVLSGIMQLGKHITMGIIPTGTINDLARTLNISKNIKKAANDILLRETIYHDVGVINSLNHFAYIATFGAFTKVAYSTPQWLKNKFGHLAYFIDGIKRIVDVKSYKVQITSDEFNEEDDYVFGCVTNTRIVAGMFKIKSSDVCFNDGLFEVILIKNPRNPIELRRILYGLINQEYDERYVKFFHTSHITFLFDKEAAWSVDGEYAGKYINVDVKNLNNAIKYIKGNC